MTNIIAFTLIGGWLAYLILPLVFMCAIALIMRPVVALENARKRQRVIEWRKQNGLSTEGF
jgi:hypothetical protein